MSRYTIAVLASSLDEDLQQALVSHPDFSVVTCNSLSTIDEFFHEHIPSLVCVDSRAFGAAWAVACAHWIERVLRLCWFVPLAVISETPDHWRRHHHPFLHTFSSDVTAGALQQLAVEHHDSWTTLAFETPLALDAMLARVCQGEQSFGARVFLESDGDEAQRELWLEVAFGRLWRCSFEGAAGVKALRQVMGERFTGALSLQVETMPLPANVMGPWQSYVPTTLKVSDGSGESWGGLATRTNIDRRSVRELLMGLEERLERDVQSAGEAHRDTPQVPIQLDYDKMHATPLGLYAPLEELRRLCELLLEGEYEAAAEKARYINQKWPDEPALNMLWLKMLL